MSNSNPGLTRRNFLQAGLAGASAVALAPLAAAQTSATATTAAPSAAPAESPLPRRKLGSEKREVTILAMGGMMQALSPEYIDQAWSMGIRYFDTAASYLRGNSELQFKRYFAKYPERRKEMFLVSKCSNVNNVQGLLTDIDKRLEACGTDHLDLVFIHGINPRWGGDIDSFEVPKSPKFKEVADKLKSSGKVKNVGFSCHDGQLVRYLNAAAEGGFVDIIMLAYDPFTAKNGEMNKALDACQKAGIGLVAMKVSRAHEAVPAKLPELEKLGLTTRQGLLQAVWSDERIAACCIGIDNLQQMQENVGAAAKFTKPLEQAHLDLLRETVLASRPTMCPGCDGRCKQACGKEDLALNDIARLVNYYERDGNVEAREWYRELAKSARDASGADLTAATKACHNHLEFAEIVKKAERYFA